MARARGARARGWLTRRRAADYRVPQVLRATGVLVLSDGLRSKVDGGAELPSGCAEEAELRAATVVAVDRLAREVAAAGGGSRTSVELDWLLWQWGEREKDTLPAHHRTLSVWY